MSGTTNGAGDRTDDLAITAATIAAVDAFNEAFNRHDVDAVMAHMTDDAVFESTSPPAGERHEGAAAVRAAWEAFFAASPNARFDAEDFFATGDRCVIRWIYTWTDDDGHEQQLHGVDVLRVREGKVAEKLAYVKG
ncbi:MAG: nuclear transport factor 2 family protein [Acidimicrobiia bacterium]|nr:nuclear transport factor 2 family protein [Acidimicrobiia bacterium]